MKIAIETLGCKLNQAESESLARRIIRSGYDIVEKPRDADIYILNTCTVTHTSDAKSRHLIRAAYRRNPDLQIIVTGCYAERAASEIKAIKGVSLVTGNTGKSDLIQILKEIQMNKKSTAAMTTNLSSLFRTRSFIKIQDGCRNFCSYCIVPFVRSPETSIPPDTIINEIRLREAEGYREVVLTGTRVGAYDFSGTDLHGLLQRLLDETTIPRIRLSSLQPQELSPELIRLWTNSRLCPHFHLSLQSGSNSVLKRMNRLYTAAEYGEAVDIIRKTVPGVAVTTDIIVGFPGETPEEFKESLEFCRKIGFARIHVFQYSVRSGTAAAEMAGQIDSLTKKERSQIMLDLAEESACKFRDNFVGESMDVLWEKQTDNGDWTGITGNYLRVSTRSEQDLSNKIIQAKVK